MSDEMFLVHDGHYSSTAAICVVASEPFGALPLSAIGRLTDTEDS